MEKNILTLINEGTSILSDIPTARLDAELLLSKVINKNKLYLLINKEENIPLNQCQEYFRLIDLRKNKMPVKYILGQCDFYGLDFHIEEGVLIPRSDTEVLVDEVIKIINNKENGFKDRNINICDLCCGSGIIGISIAANITNACVDEIDYYEKPEKVTKINIEKNNLQERVHFIKSNLFCEVLNKKMYDIIVSNPPYIKREEIKTLMSDVKDYEPISALDGGDDGLYFYRNIISNSRKMLLKNGLLAFEIGYDQGQQVKNIMKSSGYKNISIIKDLAGLDRVVLGFYREDI